ncbi:MAG: DUF1552 domain-containing protein [Lentisphaeraceae bacterium]|nr:DUF1552 domain-containing protein [Lentisphaeraceae bacterium]
MFSRRNFLKAAGVTLFLPQLESIAAETTAVTPKRFVGIQAPFGFLPQNFYPDAGPADNSSSYLKHLQSVAGKYSLFDGFNMPHTSGSHGGNVHFFTGGLTLGQKKINISLDQLLADRLIGKTRFKYINCAAGSTKAGASINSSGIVLPMNKSPKALYTNLFLGGKKSYVRQQKKNLAEKGSILDVLRQDLKLIHRDGTASDRHRLDQFTTSLRETELLLGFDKEWLDKPFPTLDNNEKLDFRSKAKGPMVDFKHHLQVFELALQNDMCRNFILDFAQSRHLFSELQASEGYHGLSHHKNSKSKLAQLSRIENEIVKIFGEFTHNLNQVPEEGGTLLDNTMVLFGSAESDPNTHFHKCTDKVSGNTYRLPIIMAGGKFKHKPYVKFKKPRPLGDAYLSIAHEMGFKDLSSFSSGKNLVSEIL